MVYYKFSVVKNFADLDCSYLSDAALTFARKSKPTPNSVTANLCIVKECW